MLLHTVLAAFVGTGLMTLSSETEATVSGRGASDSPGRAVSRVVELLGGQKLGGKSLKVASTWMHWVYGTGWGVVLWVLLDSELFGLSPLIAGIAYFAIVWGAAQVLMPLLGVAKPTWSYGGKALATDLWHHAVYAAGTLFAWWLIPIAASGEI